MRDDMCMSLRQRDLAPYQKSNYYYTQQNDQALDKIGSNHSIHSTKQGVEYANHENEGHSLLVGNSCKGLEQVSPGNRHTDQPGK